jgi:hypothetical protein
MIYSIQLINKYANKHIASKSAEHLPSNIHHTKLTMHKFPSVNQSINSSNAFNIYINNNNIYWPPLIKYSLAFKYQSMPYPGTIYHKKSY